MALCRRIVRRENIKIESDKKMKLYDSLIVYNENMEITVLCRCFFLKFNFFVKFNLQFKYHLNKKSKMCAERKQRNSH